MVEERKPISMSPDDFVEGGGLLDDVDVKVVKSRWTMFTYPNSDISVPALEWVVQAEGSDETVNQIWSVGSAKDFLPNPSDDGATLIPVGTATGIRKSSNVAVLLNSLINAGFPKDKMADGNAGVFEGLECHILRRPAPKRPGLKKPAREFEETIPEVSQIHKLPWEGGKSKGGGKAVATGDDSAIEEVVLGILAENDMKVTKRDLIPKAMKAVKDAKFRNRVLTTVNNDSWLKDSSRPWTFENGELSM